MKLFFKKMERNDKVLLKQQGSYKTTFVCVKCLEALLGIIRGNYSCDE